MADPIPISFGTGSRRSRYGLEGDPQFINAYLEDIGDGSKTGFSAYAINGNELFAALVNGSAVRAMLDFDSELLVVSGRELYSIPLAGGSPILIGGIPADGFVTMERNRHMPGQAVIVCAGLWWYYSDGVLTEGTDPDLDPPIFVCWKDGFFIFGHSTGKFTISGVDDITVDGLDFSTADSNADGLVMGAVRGPDVLLFGEKSLEIYNNTRNPDFPFTINTALNLGCWCAGSVRTLIAQIQGNLLDTVIWAATDKHGAFAGVYMLQGYSPVKVSTDEVDRLIRDEASKDDIRSFARSEDGHVFYEISGANWTRVYDTRTGYWHAIKHAGLERSRYSTYIFFGGKHVFGHATDNTLWTSSADLFTEGGGNPIDWTIITPTVHMSPARFRVNALWIGAVTGVGLVSGADEDENPVLLLDYSRDGGNNFAAQRECALGEAAQRNVRIKQRAFGRFDEKGVIWRLQCSAAVVKGLIEMFIDADKLAA